MSKGTLGVALALAIGISIQSAPITFAAAPVKPAAKPAVKSAPIQAGVKSTAPVKVAPSTAATAIRNETINLPKAQVIDLLKSTPVAFEPSDYPSSAQLPASFSSASQVVSVLDASPDIPVRMEALRRAASLTSAERDKLSIALHGRQRMDPNNVDKFFDYGYSQMTTRSNQNGLFFLRKANDRLQTQFSALAYAMAQAEVDLNNDLSPTSEMSKRKMDVRYLLQDALARDVAHHQPGFWPAYSRTLAKLKDMAPYANYAGSDHSIAYVPLGNSVVPMRGTTTSIPLKSTPTALATNSAYTSCDPTDTDAEAIKPSDVPVASRKVDFSGQTAAIEFFKSPEEADKYRVRVLAQDGYPLLSFTTFDTGRIVEDLEGDGTYEIVVRQFAHDPVHPVVVYRATPCGFELDKRVRSYFQ